VEFIASQGGLQANETMINMSEELLTLGMNVVYNESDTREMHFIVNGRDSSSSLSLEGFRCAGNCTNEDPVPDDLDPVSDV
jgi:hypothetical protein